MPTTFITQQSMINPRGRLVWVSSQETELRRSQGWKVINNPHRDYYPEFDIQAGGRSAPETIIDDLNDNDILPFEEV